MHCSNIHVLQQHTYTCIVPEVSTVSTDTDTALHRLTKKVTIVLPRISLHIRNNMALYLSPIASIFGIHRNTRRERDCICCPRRTRTRSSRRRGQQQSLRRDSASCRGRSRWQSSRCDWNTPATRITTGARSFPTPGNQESILFSIFCRGIMKKIIFLL